MKIKQFYRYLLNYKKFFHTKFFLKMKICGILFDFDFVFALLFPHKNQKKLRNMEDARLDQFLSRVEDTLKKLSKSSYAYKLLNEAAVSAILASKRKSSRHGLDETSIDRLVARYTIVKVPTNKDNGSSMNNNSVGNFEDVLEKAKPAHFPDNFLQLLNVEQATATTGMGNLSAATVSSQLQWRVKEGKSITIKNHEYKEKELLPVEYSIDLETLARSLHVRYNRWRSIKQEVIFW